MRRFGGLELRRWCLLYRLRADWRLNRCQWLRTRELHDVAHGCAACSSSSTSFACSMRPTTVAIAFASRPGPIAMKPLSSARAAVSVMVIISLMVWSPAAVSYRGWRRFTLKTARVSVVKTESDHRRDHRSKIFVRGSNY